MREPYKLLDLFSGIGGFSLGLERTGGFKTVAFCEIEPFPRKVLAKHWPKVPIYDDVRNLNIGRLLADGIAIDAICGGFPCQDISSAGKREGIGGDRSGLWREYARLIGEIRPRVVIVENVAELLNRGLGDVLGGLASLGYDAEWHCIPAASVGAPHIRDRIWIVAYPHGGCVRSVFANREDGRTVPAQEVQRLFHRGDSGKGALADANRFPMVGAAISRQERNSWPAEPDVGRVVDGIPRELVEPRLRALGNSVVPQIPYAIGRAILSAMAAA
jgi:DNA (cytosine-5)-methyltransferase 1